MSTIDPTRQPLAQAIPNGNLSRLQYAFYNDFATFPDRARFMVTIREFAEYAISPQVEANPSRLPVEARGLFIGLIVGKTESWEMAQQVIQELRIDKSVLLLTPFI
jgi:hypothetical protein